VPVVGPGSRITGAQGIFGGDGEDDDGEEK
jgi:hypothetical protein